MIWTNYSVHASYIFIFWGLAITLDRAEILHSGLFHCFVYKIAFPMVYNVMVLFHNFDHYCQTHLVAP